MFQKILEMMKTNGYINLARSSKNLYKVGPIGLLLLNNLQTQWYNNILINRDITSFLDKGNINNTYDFAKQICLEKLPFGIADKITPVMKPSTKEKLDNELDKKRIHFKDLFPAEDQFKFRSTIFVSSETATQFFHQWQKQRRIWWRKFSASPGRYYLTDIRIKNVHHQSVDITAEYPWGKQLLETITMTDKTADFPAAKLQYKESKKNVQAWIITSEVNIPVMFLNAVCDAFDEPLYRDNERQVLRLHRKLAPYRISFAISSSSVTSELKDLALYLSKQMREHYIPTLFLPSSYKYTLETQYRQYDQLGIPYTILLNDKTLADGISYLRSRDTTLKEQVHVSSLIEYIEMLFKND